MEGFFGKIVDGFVAEGFDMNVRMLFCDVLHEMRDLAGEELCRYNENVF